MIVGGLGRNSMNL